MTDPATTAEPARPGWLVAAVIVVTCVAGVVLLGVAWRLYGGPRDLVALIVLQILAMASWLVRIQLLAKVTLAANNIISLAAVVLVGPFGSGVISTVSMLTEVGRRPWRVRIFNGAMGAVLGVTGGMAYRLAGGATDLVGLEGVLELLLRVGGPIMVAAVVQTVLNALLLAAVIWADQGGSYRRLVSDLMLNNGLGQIGFGVIGLLFVILWVPAGVGPFSAVLILLPLFVARWAFVQYREEQAAHERTLAAFVAAVGAHDPQAVPHLERVATVCAWISESMGLGSQQTTALRYAAMLHDVGWVGTPVRPTSTGAAAGRVMVTRHLEQATELFGEVSFLGESLDGIRHHFEWYDGSGLPDGLAGERVPLAARIVAVADAFDTLTAGDIEHPGRSTTEALAELAERSGTQFDPQVVAALGRALERNPWTPGDTPVTEPVPALPVDAVGAAGGSRTGER